MANVTAIWTVELNCTCPNCDKSVDLLDYPDFWDCRHLDIAENGTERSKNVDVICPECDHEFTVDCEY
jgi:Zn finger protein HypA/HybF involved in hydrogenase expression